MADKKPIAKLLTSDFVPCSEAEFRWMFIDQPGKKGPGDDDSHRLVASIYVKSDSDGCKALIGAIDQFWKDNKPKGAKKCKSAGYKPEIALKEGGDADNEDDYQPTGFTAFNFWTGTHWPAKGDDEPVEHKIKVYNARGNEVQLGGKRIGNGSQGAVNACMGIYDRTDGKGVTLYLNSIQITKFVEFTGSDGFDAVEDAEDGWAGPEDSFEGGEPEARPEL